MLDGYALESYLLYLIHKKGSHSPISCSYPYHNIQLIRLIHKVQITTLTRDPFELSFELRSARDLSANELIPSWLQQAFTQVPSACS